VTIAGTAHFGTLRASFDVPPIRSSDGEKREPAVFLAGRSDGGVLLRRRGVDGVSSQLRL